MADNAAPAQHQPNRHHYTRRAPVHSNAGDPQTACVRVTLFYDLYSFTDPVIATAVPALGNAFFALFGTNG